MGPNFGIGCSQWLVLSEDRFCFEVRQETGTRSIAMRKKRDNKGLRQSSEILYTSCSQTMEIFLAVLSK